MNVQKDWRICEVFLEYCNRREGAEHNFWKNGIAQGHNLNWLKSNGTETADKTRPWSWIGKWNDCWKTKEWVMAQIQEISAPFPKIVGMVLQLISIWNYPAYKS